MLQVPSTWSLCIYCSPSPNGNVSIWTENSRAERKTSNKQTNKQTNRTIIGCLRHAGNSLPRPFGTFLHSCPSNTENCETYCLCVSVCPYIWLSVCFRNVALFYILYYRGQIFHKWSNAIYDALQVSVTLHLNRNQKSIIGRWHR